MLSTQEVK